MKKTLCALLCLLTVLSVMLVSCTGTNNQGGESKDSTSTAETSTGEESTVDTEYYDEATGKYVLASDMPDFDFTETEFKVAVIDNISQSTYFNEDIENLYDTTDEAIRTAVSERNNIIEEKYGVKIKAYAVSDIYNEIIQDAEGGTGLYDAAMPFMSTAATLAASSKLYDLSSYAALHFDAPYWEAIATDTAEIGGKVYFTTGDISMMPKIVSFAITFNKDLLNDIDSSVDLYQEVIDGTWTFDRLVQLSKAATSDSDGTAGMAYTDNWGLSSSYNDALAYYIAAGETLCAKDANGKPIISIGTQRSVNVAIDLLTKLEERDTWAYICNRDNGVVPNIWATSLDVFGEGRCLFRTTAFSAIKKLRAYTKGVEFGIVPLPKYDTEQDEYYTYSNPNYAACVVIHLGAKNPEFSAYMLEVLACESKNYLTPAYYETVLKDRDMKDEESEQMLDEYVFKNIVYDIGVVYNFGSIGSLLSGLMSTDSVAVASTLDNQSGTYQAAIDVLLEAFGVN